MYINIPGHMTKIAVMPMYGKNPSKSSSPEPVDRSNETWHEVSMTQVLQSIYKSRPFNDLDLFYYKVNIGWGNQCVYK